MKLQLILLFAALAICSALNLDTISERIREKIQRGQQGKDEDKMNPFDEYINKVDPHYKWFDTGVAFPTNYGGMAYMLNVTSQQWLDVSRAYGPGNTSIWTHQVAVIIPKVLLYPNVSVNYLTIGCNEHPHTPDPDDGDFMNMDQIANNTGVVAFIVWQIPNCHIIYPSDPSKTPRHEDAMIAWAWHEYLETGDPKWLPRFPMVKAAFQCMRAVEEFTREKKLADITGHIVTGRSKRGWTSWMTGAATCEKCPEIIGIIPMVPIVPAMMACMHRQWKSYNGWTFAFKDYTDVNMTTYVDDPRFISLLDLVDPMNYYDRLARIPKLTVVGADDELMQFDWTELWYNEIKGESHLLIIPNAQHGLETGNNALQQTVMAFVSSVAQGHTQEDRPDFTYTYDNVTGEITVTVPEKFKIRSVKLVYAQTIQNTRRDWR